MAASTLKFLLQPDAAFLAVQRAVELAESAADPLLAVAVKGAVSWQLRVSGRCPVRLDGVAQGPRQWIRTEDGYVQHGRLIVGEVAEALGRLIEGGCLALGRPDLRGHRTVGVTVAGQSRYAELRAESGRG